MLSILTIKTKTKRHMKSFGVTHTFITLIVMIISEVWLWWWYLRYMPMSKLITMYTLNMCKFLYIKYTSINRGAGAGGGEKCWPLYVTWSMGGVPGFYSERETLDRLAEKVNAESKILKITKKTKTHTHIYIKWSTVIVAGTEFKSKINANNFKKTWTEAIFQEKIAVNFSKLMNTSTYKSRSSENLKDKYKENHTMAHYHSKNVKT